MAQTCNLIYLEGRNQEDQGLKFTQTNNLRDPILKIPNTERAGGEVQGAEQLNSKSSTEKKILAIFVRKKLLIRTENGQVIKSIILGE
jgi:hypothetical protein